MHYGAAFEDISVTLKRLVEQTRNSERTPLMSVLIEGAAFTGKTALAASSAVNSGFPFVRKICADEMVSFMKKNNDILQHLCYSVAVLRMSYWFVNIKHRATCAALSTAYTVYRLYMLHVQHPIVLVT